MAMAGGCGAPAATDTVGGAVADRLLSSPAITASSAALNSAEVSCMSAVALLAAMETEGCKGDGLVAGLAVAVAVAAAVAAVAAALRVCRMALAKAPGVAVVHEETVEVLALRLSWCWCLARSSMCCRSSSVLMAQSRPPKGSSSPLAAGGGGGAAAAARALRCVPDAAADGTLVCACCRVNGSGIADDAAVRCGTAVASMGSKAIMSSSMASSAARVPGLSSTPCLRCAGCAAGVAVDVAVVVAGCAGAADIDEKADKAASCTPPTESLRLGVEGLLPAAGFG